MLDLSYAYAQHLHSVSDDVLRDHFAGLALIAIRSNGGGSSNAYYATEAYRLADAMLATMMLQRSPGLATPRDATGHTPGRGCCCHQQSSETF